jgi:16S rRNA (guanine527-N7)-methyltransferase
VSDLSDIAALSRWAGHFSRPAEQVSGDLNSFEALLRKWQAAQNLVSRETLSDFWTRHIADSLQVLPLLPDGAAHIYDLGTGGGFPGLPLAIATKGSEKHFSLCESNGRKVAFLRAAIRQLGLDAEVLPGRIEALVSRETARADVVTSRALAPLNLLFELAFPLLKPSAVLILHKGRENSCEIDEAGANWQFDVVKHISTTNDQGVLLQIANLGRKS